MAPKALGGPKNGPLRSKEGPFKPIQTQGFIRPAEGPSRQKEGLWQLDRALYRFEKARLG